LVDTDQTLIMLRADLAAHAAPLPPLQGPSFTSDLYFDAPTCAWGDAPDFLQVPGEPAPGTGVEIPTHVVSTGTATVTGWAVDHHSLQPARQVVAVSDGRVVATATPDVARPDVAQVLRSNGAIMSGFDISVPTGAATQLYSLNDDGTLSALGVGAGAAGPLVTPGTAAAVTMPDGAVSRVSHSGPSGDVDSVAATHGQIDALSVPKGLELSSYRWMQLASTPALAPGSVTVTDALGVASHEITFNVMASKAHLAVQVGSCQQWHGFERSDLVLVQSTPGPPPIVRLAR